MIAPSILSANFWNLGEDINLLKKLGVKLLHMDVMDGNFVPNISYGPMILEFIKNNSDLKMDAHLMIQEPSRYLDKFIDLDLEYLTIHYEAAKHVDRDLTYIRNKGIKSGIALNPGTHPEVLEYIYDKLDLVLIMTVNPGFGGQKFIESGLRKIEYVKNRIVNLGLDIKLEVDGGVNPSNIKQIYNSGADIVVCGSSLFNGNIENNYKQLIR